MKIGILSREYPPLTHVGGIATYSAAAAALLAAHGHEVHVVCSGVADGIESAGGITVHRLKMREHHFPVGRLFYPYRARYRKYLPHYLEALTWARTAAHYLATRLDPGGFDAWEYPETGGEGAFFPDSGARGPRLICRIHTGWMDAYAENRWERMLLLRLQRKACLRSDHLVSPSAYMAGSYVRDTLGINRFVTVSKNPIRLWEKPLPKEAKDLSRLLYVGRVEHRKGLQVLLKALDELGEEARGLTLRVVGQMYPPTRELDRSCQAFFAARLAEYGKPEGTGSGGYRIEYIGPCDHADMPRHFDWAGIQVLPSLMENYPYAALEGLSRGCFLIGSEVGGIPEIIDRPGRGMLFTLENSTQLAGKIRECRRRDREISGGLRDMAEEIRSEFDPETCYLRLMETYGADLPQRVTG